MPLKKSPKKMNNTNNKQSVALIIFGICLLLATVAGSLWMAKDVIKKEQPPVDVDRVQLAMPKTYFPTDIRIGFVNNTSDTLRTVRFRADYRSPNAEKLHWTRVVECRELFLPPGERWKGKCFFNGSPPPKRTRYNAAVFLKTLATQ